MKLIYTPQHELVKNEVKDYFAPSTGLWWDGVGVGQDFPLIVFQLGTYNLTIPARIGDNSGQKAYLGGYEVSLNGQIITMTWDEANITRVDTIFGGAWMSTLKTTITYTKQINTLTIKSKLRWIAVGPIDDGQPENVTGISQLKYDTDVKAAYEKGKIDGKVGMLTQAQVDTMLKSNTETLKAGYAVVIADEVEKAKEAQAAKIVPFVSAVESAIVEVKKAIG